MRGTVISAMYGVSAVIVLTFFAVWRWLDPMTPLYVGLAAIFLPALVVAIFLDPETRPPNIDVLVLAQAALVAGIFGIAVPLMWSAPAIRLGALEAFPSKRAVQLALEDHNEGVQRSACSMIVTDRFDFGINETYQALVTRPRLATACLDELPAGSGSMDVREKLARVWFQTLMTGEQSCDYLEGLDGLSLPPTDSSGMLISCTLHAQALEHRKCCSERLIAGWDGQKRYALIDSARQQLRANGSAGYLLAAAWQEQQFVASLDGIDGRLALSQKAYRALSADIACEAAVAGTAEGDPTTSYLSWLFEQESKCMGPDAREIAPEPRAACVEFLADPARSQDVSAALCRADQTVRMRRMKESSKVRAGVDLGDFAENIDVGRAHDQGMKLSADNFKDLVESGDIANLTEEERSVLGDSMLEGVPTQLPDEGTQAEAVAKAERTKTGDGQAQLVKEHADAIEGMDDIERAMGISAQELMEAVGEDGEVSDEMKARIDAISKQKR